MGIWGARSTNVQVWIVALSTSGPGSVRNDNEVPHVGLDIATAGRRRGA